MAETISRSDFARSVFDLLAKPSFVSRLNVEAEDGTKPVVIAMPTDMLSVVLKDVAASGDCGNIVVPQPEDRIVVVGMCVLPAMSAAQKFGAQWLSDCTVQEFLDRLASDGGSATYRFTADVNSDDTSAQVSLDEAA